MVHCATSRAAVAAALAAATALGGCMSTANYGTGESPEVAIFREMTGGVLSPKKEPVVYRPRAPLVLPPSAGQLPAPAPPPEVASAQWPDDPDKRAEGVKVFAENPRDEVARGEYQRLKPLSGAAPGPRIARRATNNDPDFQPQYDMVGKKQQRDSFKAAINDAEGFSSERRFLTDPPETVRAPAPTAPQKFEEIDKKKDGNFFTRMFTRG
jgi:hypothetical protein